MLRNFARAYPIINTCAGKVLQRNKALSNWSYVAVNKNAKILISNRKPVSMENMSQPPAKCTRSYSAITSAGGDVKVMHDKLSHLFYIDVPGQGRAFLEYEKHGNLVRLLHTEVPKKLEGRGLGKILAKEALDYVVKNDLRAEIECEFVKHYVKKYDPGFIKYLKS